MSDDSAALEVSRTAELDLNVRDLARTVRARTELLAVSDQTGEAIEVLGTRGDALNLDVSPTL